MAAPLLLLLLGTCLCSPEPGLWDLQLEKENNYVAVVKNAYKGSRLDIRVQCNTTAGSDFKVKVGYALRRTICWEEYLTMGRRPEDIEADNKRYYSDPSRKWYELPGTPLTYKPDYIKNEFQAKCDDLIHIHPHSSIKPVTPPPLPTPQPSSSFSSSSAAAGAGAGSQGPVSRKVREVEEKGPGPNAPVYKLEKDGVYLLVVYVGALVNTQKYKASVHIEIKSEGSAGYLSITDWPLLPFYGLMCGLYVLLGLVWLLVCSLHWREILRIQFWIGGVLLLGMLEKAMFTAEYQNISNSGQATSGLILAAEITSCAKRTLARMLVIIVSLGFGIVKPRLGPTLHRVVGVGGLYFLLASVESVLRVIHPKNDPGNRTLLAAVPLAVIDASLCWWVFSALIQTTRTLRLRRNTVKLSVYKHFTNTLVFAVVTSIIFMLWSIKYHKVVDCLTQWKDLWVDEAFWHLLFSVILCVIMVLWRPSQNNQRYAFTPLLDKEEDYSSDEDILYSDAWEGMKMRGKGQNSRPETPDGADPELDPLKWVEENIPDVEGALPIIDSEEEIETTKVEISKMM